MVAAKGKLSLPCASLCICTECYTIQSCGFISSLNRADAALRSICRWRRMLSAQDIVGALVLVEIFSKVLVHSSVIINIGYFEPGVLGKLTAVPRGFQRPPVASPGPAKPCAPRLEK